MTIALWKGQEVEKMTREQLLAVIDELVAARQADYEQHERDLDVLVGKS